MNSHAHVILELPAPKEVSLIWDINLSASSSSQDFSRLTGSRDRQSATNTPSYRCCPGSLLTSSACCTTLPVHRSSPALNSVALKVQIPLLKATVWYYAIRRPCTRHHVHHQNLLLGFQKCLPPRCYSHDSFWEGREREERRCRFG